ncbi:hypothetical protein GJ744_001270 [Endocarpon pusillum]|uniref:Uncharacterized protein n=1 Tax=Endocarpon pusillum TaxID=364733 RepID=A0A8H7ADD7_9EURO|nr:hypothetical protein GJ744_001270 [Endocarpon pusillum]
MVATSSPVHHERNRRIEEIKEIEKRFRATAEELKDLKDKNAESEELMKEVAADLRLMRELDTMELETSMEDDCSEGETVRWEGSDDGRTR